LAQKCEMKITIILYTNQQFF